MSQADMWRWADEQGEQRLVSEDELRSAIAGGVLPASTLVWREGMSAWVPASSVTEFADVIASAGHAAEKAPTNASPEPTPNAGAVGPSKATLQGLHARELHSAIKEQEKEIPEKKRTSVAPPRPTSGSVKPPPAHTRTLRPNTGPAIPAAPRLPSESPPKPAVVAPRALGVGPKPGPPIGPAKAAPAAAMAPRPSTTTNIDKDWGIADEETTNVPEKTAPIAPRPEPPTEAAAPEVAAPQPPAVRQTQPSLNSISRAAPPPSPNAERSPIQETTESTTFQFSKNTLSIRTVKPGPNASGNHQGASGAEKAAPPGLMESYGKPSITSKPSVDEAPPTAPSADLATMDDDQIPAYAGKTIRLEDLQEAVRAASASPAASAPAPASAALPEPPKVREPTLTTMLPIEFQNEAPEDGGDKLPHEVSRTVRLDTEQLNKAIEARKEGKAPPLAPEQDKQAVQFKPPPMPLGGAPAAAPAQVGQFGPVSASSQQTATLPPGAAVHFPGAGTPPPPQLPLNALLMSGGMLIVMVVTAFFVGRSSVKPSANNAPSLRSGFSSAVRVLQDNLPTQPKPCWVIRQPARWAGIVGKNSSFDLLELPSGKIAIGFAKSEDEAAGIEVAPLSGQVQETFSEKAKSELARVVPTGKGFYAVTLEAPGSLKSLVAVSGDKPFYLGIADKQLAWADQPSGAVNRIWPISDDDGSSVIRALSLGSRGVLTAVRAGSSRQKKVFAGLLGPDHKGVTNLVNVVGSGGLAGEPMVGANGREVAVVFGDQAGEQSPWKVRIGHAAFGKIPATTTQFDVPAGGPGGDANYPSIVGLADGRWVLVWTEGSSYAKVVRAQTFAPNFTPVGDPIVLSQPGWSYGASMVGVVGNNVTVVFVQKGKSNSELWGSVLQCG